MPEANGQRPQHLGCSLGALGGGGGMGGCARAPKGACVQKAEAHHFQQQALVLVNSGDVTTAVSMA